ncbi:MAG TPA: phosphate acyltransferase PlsX [Chitinophagaceae bacterium]|nr:phosphate acyltransferase PlsX [Chitinophagaceae bacterium]
MRIGLDMMGGDFAPEQSCLGVRRFLESYTDCHLVLLGDEEAIRTGLPEWQSLPVTIVPTSGEIGMHEHPTRAMKEKQSSAMVQGFGLLAADKTDAFISAGNTGVMLVGASHMVKTIEGLLRPTIPTPVPQIQGGKSLMLDIGINADCKPEYLNQFAVLGSFYAREILGTENPSVALLNIGEEEGKGNLLAQAAYPLLKQNQKINFIGNIEGRDILDNKADIIITDGFTGNILLKFAESLYDVIRVKGQVESAFLDQFNHRLYAGVPVLGIRKPVVVGHGVSNAESFAGMLELARKLIISKMCFKMENAFTELPE